MTKECLVCKNVIKKKANWTKQYWEVRKYCSVQCYCSDKTVVRSTTFTRGHVPHNKDTKGIMVAWNKGIPVTEETKIKISNRQKGNKYRKGKYNTQETKDKIRYIKVEQYKNNPELRLKLSTSHKGQNKGENNPNWRGGVSSINKTERQQFMGTLEYKQWRLSVFIRDDFSCVLCGVRGVRLNADHIQSYAEYPDLRLDLSNGRTLCEPCHRQTADYGGRSRK